MKRFISIALVAMLLAISLPLGAFAVEDETPAIVSQPTLADPTFVVSPDDGVTYQWYVADADMVTDSDAVPVTKDYLIEMYGEIPDNVKFLKEESTFDHENGKWSPAYYSMSDPAAVISAEADAVADEIVEYFLVPFYVPVGAGAQYIVIIDGVEAPNLQVFEINYYEEAIFSNVADNVYTVSFGMPGTYLFTIITETAPEDPYITVIEDVTSDEAIEGETSATLSCDMETNAYYYCIATYPDETELMSDFVSKSYYVTKQPTLADPSVKVSSSDEVEGYQWYTFEKSENIAVTDKNASAYGIADVITEMIGDVPPGFSLPSIKAESSYDSENDLWIPFVLDPDFETGAVDQIIMGHFVIELNEGDSITITAEDFSVFAEFEVGTLSSGIVLEFVENDDGSRTYVADVKGSYILISMVAFETAVDESSINPEDYAISACGSVSSPVMIEGETKATLSEMTYGEKYFCEITYLNGAVIESKTFKAIGEITKQPTATSPTVGVTFPEAVESYEWYKVIASDYGSVTPFMVGSYTTENTNKILGIPSDAVIYNDASSYDPETEIWTPVNYSSTNYSYDYAEFFVIYMEEGESLDVEFVNGFEDSFRKDLYLYSVAYDEYVDAVENSDGTYTITVDVAGEYLLCYDAYSENFPEGFGAKVYKNNVFDDQIIEGQTGNTLTEKVAGETYMCVITYEDGAVLTTDMFDVTEDDMWRIGDIDNDGDVDKEDYIAVKRSCFGTRILTAEEQLCADVNKDGEVTKEDYLLIKRSCFGTYMI